jgi:hypothetical protein
LCRKHHRYAITALITTTIIISSHLTHFSQMNFAFCIPSTCTHKELELVLAENLQNFFNNTGLRMDVRVEPEMCQTKRHIDEPYSIGTKLAL